jgi:DNA-binding beta-propeller fold protein YncE
MTDRVAWERTYAGGCCGRLDVSPDGGTLYAPALGAPKWYVIDAADGRLVSTIDVQGYPRQTIFAPDGSRVFLAAWDSPVISIVDAKTRAVVKEAGPFGSSVCPFTVNGRGTMAFANVDGLVGFETADLETGLVLDRVIVEDSDKDAWARYECPSHGIALTPDERELWVADGVANRLHVFDAGVYPPVLSRSIALQAQPRWITFGADGRYAYVSTGDVVDTASKAIVASLQDDRRMPLHSEVVVEIDFSRGHPVRGSLRRVRLQPDPQ